MGSCLATCVAGCIQLATDATDKYNNWRWEQDDGVYPELDSLTNTGHQYRTIHAAVIDKNVAEVKRIVLEDESARNAVNSSSETALHAACKLGYKPVIEELLQCGCSADVHTELGTPIHCLLQAVKSGYLTSEEAVYFIYKLAHKGCKIDRLDRGGKTALFSAAELGDKHCLQALLNLGADVNQKEANQFSPLYMACIRGDLDCVQALLQMVPILDIDARDSAGRTPLVAALVTIMINLKYEKMPNDVYTTPPNITADDLDFTRHNRIAVVEALLRYGANPNAVDHQDRTPLSLVFMILELDNIHILHMFNHLSAKTGLKKASPSATTMGKVYQEESAYATLVRLLLLYGAKPPSGWTKNYEKAPEWLKQLYDICTEEDIKKYQRIERPNNLQHIVRISIRSHLASVQKLQLLHQLPIPSKMIDYMKIRFI